MARIAADAFGAWKSATAFKPVPVSFAATKNGKQTVETPDKANALFVAGQSFPMKDTDPDYPTLLLINYMLGENPLDSRLPSRMLRRLCPVGRPIAIVLGAHGVLLPRMMQRNPTWLVEVSTGSAWRAAGRYRRQ